MRMKGRSQPPWCSVTFSCRERHLGQLSSPLSGGKAQGTALLHPEAPREREEKPWGAAMPKVLHSPVCLLGSASPDSGGRAEDIPPPSSTTVGPLAPQCPGPGWRPPAHGAGRGHGHSFHGINMATEFARGQSWE